VSQKWGHCLIVYTILGWLIFKQTSIQVHVFDCWTLNASDFGSCHELVTFKTSSDYALKANTTFHDPYMTEHLVSSMMDVDTWILFDSGAAAFSSNFGETTTTQIDFWSTLEFLWSNTCWVEIDGILTLATILYLWCSLQCSFSATTLVARLPGWTWKAKLLYDFTCWAKNESN
jgi:hypothetical protein